MFLSSLVRAYDRLPDAPPFGYSLEKISFCISLNEDGSVAHVIDLRDTSKKKPQPKMMLVPQPVKKASGILPNTFWEKTSYALGVTAGEGKRTAREHAAFVLHHEQLLEKTDDRGLAAFLKFLSVWQAEQFETFGWSEEMKDTNIVFALESDRLNRLYLHDRPEAKDVLAEAGGQGAEATRRLSGHWAVRIACTSSPFHQRGMGGAVFGSCSCLLQPRCLFLLWPQAR